MGTRADFYIGRGEQAEWLGSIGFDGYPEAVFAPSGAGIFLQAIGDAEGWRKAVLSYIRKQSSGTMPGQGWPWPWDDSGLTDYDYAYAFDDGKVWASCFGSEWFNPAGVEPEYDDSKAKVTFPNMAAAKNVTFGARSGLTIVGPDGPLDLP